MFALLIILDAINAETLFVCRKLLSENKHVKYLHIPYTDTVVVVTCNPISKWKGVPKFKPKFTADEAIQHVRDFYKEALHKYRFDFINLVLMLSFVFMSEF